MTQENITVDRSATKGWKMTHEVNVSGVLFLPSSIRCLPKQKSAWWQIISSPIGQIKRFITHVSMV